jgi:hypothetical protein
MFQYVFITEKRYEYFSDFEFFLDLNQLSNFAKYSSQANVLSNPQGIPEAIKLPESTCEKIGFREDDVYLCFVCIKDHKELNEKMLDYLFS